jgi:major type 1 subunit fimbrin (pilin)
MFLAPNPKSAIRNPQSAIRNPQSAIRNPQSEIRNPSINLIVDFTEVKGNERQEIGDRRQESITHSA